MSFFAFDPSTVATGIAEFDPWQKRLLSVCVVEAENAEEMINEIGKRFSSRTWDQFMPSFAVVETPINYKNDRMPPAKLRQLILVAGACRAHFSTSSSISPHGWNHGRPKAITEHRIRALLNEKELAMVVAVPAKIRNNAFDAVGVGLHHLKRLK